ncbi:MAG TPA: diguanylate cyclase [Termitinemataceae bacterium]|nr:diguanylate cyclase [Termitinemataceae bacterium]HOM23092.1 diguanylate cyclase [Termitinemataceae bacterium]HPP99942.1 diguanylate cyclase [Termitinemataceae bacterium]
MLLCGMEFDDGDADSLIMEMSHVSSREVPVLIVTSTDSLTLREHFFSLGVADYILKDEVDEARLRRFFDAQAAEDELSRYMRNLRVAVLDDSKVIIRLLHSIFSMYGFTNVESFQDPQELLNRTEGYDIYLIDMVLPGTSGDQVVNVLRERFPEAVIICMSQFAGEKSLTSVLLAGADDYIHKPFDGASLISRLKINVRAYKYRKQLERMVLIDPLTELYNRRYLFEQLEQEEAKARRYGRAFSVIMVDIDNFKEINDTKGHLTGDRILQTLGSILQRSVRAADVVGRYGGEEFLLVLPETEEEPARLVAEKIRKSVANSLWPDGVSGVTVSLGVAGYQQEEPYEDLLRRADARLYQAKREGKNRVV